jgi:serine O-acetyltransferase
MESVPSDRPQGLWRQIKEDWQHNGRDWTRPGFRALAVHRFGTWRMTIRVAPLRWPMSVLYRMLFRYVRNHYGIELFYTTRVGRRVQIGHQGAIVIHEHAVIGDECVIRQGVTIGAASLERVREAPVLGRGVELGAGAVIVGAVKIGDGARIGPNAVVMMNVPAGATAFAMPARIMPAPTAPRQDPPQNPGAETKEEVAANQPR